MLWSGSLLVGSIAVMDARAARSARKGRRPVSCVTALLWGFLAVAAAYGVFLLVLGVILAVRGR
jgi:hypothetical protein